MCLDSCVARKPFKGTIKANVAAHGTGCLNVDACKVGERWAPNLIHDGDDAVVGMFPEKAGALFSAKRTVATTGGSGNSLMGKPVRLAKVMELLMSLALLLVSSGVLNPHVLNVLKLLDILPSNLSSL